jgi:hypothetical protein
MQPLAHMWKESGIVQTKKHGGLAVLIARGFLADGLATVYRECSRKLFRETLGSSYQRRGNVLTSAALYWFYRKRVWIC